MVRAARAVLFACLAAALAAACSSSTDAAVRHWTVTWSAVVTGGAGQIDSLTWKEDAASYRSTMPSVSWNWTAPLTGGQTAYLKAWGTASAPAAIRVAINAVATDGSTDSSASTCSGTHVPCELGPRTLP